MAELLPMPFLGQPADPIGSLGRGVQVGADIRQASQSRRLFGLQEQALRLKNKIEDHQLNELERMLRVREDNTVAFGELSKLISESVSGGRADDPALALSVSGLLARNPSLLEEKRTATLMDFFQKSLMLRQKEKELQQKMGLDPAMLAQRAQQMGLEPSTLNEQGNVTFARPREGPATTPGAFQKDIEFLKSLGAQITPEHAQKYYEAKILGPNETIESTPGGGFRITRGGAAQGDLTTATKTRLQEQAMSNEEAIATLGEVITGIQATPGAIGVRGKVGQFVEQAKGQISPGAEMETPITDVRQKASVAFSRVAPALRVDSGNMSRYELNKLEQAGDVLGIEEAPQTALKKLRNLQAVVVARQLRVLKAQSQKPDDALLRQIQGEEIAALLQSGLLSKEDAIRLFQLNKANGR